MYTTSTELVSIIVPIYNVEKYLDNCILSIINQTYCNLEIILIDDGSTDSCPTICDNWKVNDERITVYHTSNNGLCKARNLGLSVAKGDYIYFCDSDDFLDCRIIEYLLTALKDADADVSICKEYAFFNESEITNNTNNTILFNKTENREEVLLHFTDNFTGPISWMWNKLYTKSIIDKFIFDPNFESLEDLYFNLKIMSTVNKVTWIDNKMYFYRQHASSIMHKNYNHTLKAWTNTILYQANFLKGKCSDYNYSKQVSFCLRAIFRRQVEAHNKKLIETKQDIFNTYCNLYSEKKHYLKGYKNKIYCWLIKNMNFIILNLTVQKNNYTHIK